MAFLFGSQASGRERKASDWDIAVYFTPVSPGELETEHEYLSENEISSGVERIVRAEVDFLVLNRARPSLVFSILNSGTSLVIKDRTLYTKLLLKTYYEALDFWDFVSDFWRIRQRARSLSPEDKAVFVEHVVFLENEFEDIETFKVLTWKEYLEERDKRRNIERWIENLVMAALDIAKIILASERKDVPETYQSTLKTFWTLYIDSRHATQFSKFADLRNIVVHEYLDIRWKRIQKFIHEAQELYPEFIKTVRKIANL